MSWIDIWPLSPRISLEQWRSLLAVVDAGRLRAGGRRLAQEPVRRDLRRAKNGIAPRREDLRGHWAQGAPHRDRAKCSIGARKPSWKRPGALESAAGSLAAGWEPELRLAVEIVFPTWLLLEALRASRGSGRTLASSSTRRCSAARKNPSSSGAWISPSARPCRPVSPAIA